MKTKKTMFCIAKMLLILLVFNFQIKAQEFERETTQKISDIFKNANQWLQESGMRLTESPEMAFVDGYVLVAAEGLPSQNARTPSQKRLTAERAATVLAYRQLAEILNGIAVVGDSRVEDMVLKYDSVRAAVSGFVKGAQIVFKEWDPENEIALVFVKVGMEGPKGFAKVMYDNLTKHDKINAKEPPFKAKTVEQDSKYDGVIVDVRELNFKPALINRIYSPQKSVVFDPASMDKNIFMEYGSGEYTTSIEKAKEALAKRGVKNPIVIKGIDVISSADVVISEADAVKVYSANQKTNFLREGKVAFVLNIY